MSWSDLLPFVGIDGVPSPRRFAFLLASSVVFDLALALFILLRRAPASITVGRVALAAGAVLATIPIDAVVMRPLGLRRLGVIHQAWHDVSIVAPLVVLVLLLFAWHRATRGARAIAVLVLALWPGAGYARFVEPRRLIVEEHDVPTRAAAPGAEPLRVVVLADLQTDEITDHERRAIARIEELAPDLILIPGDVFQGCQRVFEEIRAPLRALLGRLDAPGGVWFSYGDVDPKHRIDELFAGTAVRVLENELAEVSVKGRRVVVCGLGRVVETGEARGAVARLLARDEATPEVRIVLAHHPEAVDLLPPDAPVDLTVTGHTHGGQVVVPLFGPPMTLTRMPRRIGAGGLGDWRGNPIVVSRGVGHERGQAPRVRFLAPPELTLLRIGGGDRLSGEEVGREATLVAA